MAELCLACVPSPETGLEPEGEPVPTVQHLLAFARPLAARVRSVRRPFHPSTGEGAYRLPHEIRDRLTAALAPFRNREAAYALATFIARFWSVPGRVASAFPIDRRALADHGALDLTEARVRGAIRALEAVGFLERALAPSGSRYRPTADGLQRKPILFVFGPEYAPSFLAANARARAARGGDRRARRPVAPANAPRPSTGLLEAPHTNSPKNKSVADPQVLMGEVRRDTDLPTKLSAPSTLELALHRLGEGVFGKLRVG